MDNDIFITRDLYTAAYLLWLLRRELHSGESWEDKMQVRVVPLSRRKPTYEFVFSGYAQNKEREEELHKGELVGFLESIELIKDIMFNQQPHATT